MNSIRNQLEYRIGFLSFQIDSHDLGGSEGIWMDGKIAQMKEERQFLQELQQKVQ